MRGDKELPKYETYEQLIEEYFLPLCIRYGMNINAFYRYTIFEIKTYLNAKIEKENDEFKNQAIVSYRLADMIGASVARLFSKQAKFPKIEKVYPGIFESEEKKIDPAEQYKADLFAWANNHNEKLRERKALKERRELMKKQGLIPEDIDIPDSVPAGGEKNYVDFIMQIRKYDLAHGTNTVIGNPNN